MGKPRIVAGVEVGSTKICALVAELGTDGLTLLAASAVAAAGIHRGAIVDLNSASHAISQALNQVAAEADTRIGGVLLGIGCDIASLNSRGMTLGSTGTLSSADAVRAIEAAVDSGLPSTRQVIHAIPRSFRIDGQAEVDDPSGLFGRRLDADVHLLTASNAAVCSLVAAVESSGFVVEEVVAKPLAAAEAVLAPEERDLGVAVADLGAGSSGIGVFVDGSPWHTNTLPIGGRHLTQDVATVLGISYDVAEELKLSAGHSDPEAVDPLEEIQVPAIGDDSGAKLSRRYLCSILEARVSELLNMIGDEIGRSGYEGLLPAGLVLTGGTAQLPGLAKMASETLRLRVRVGRSEFGAGAGLGGPAFSGAVGLLLWRAHSSVRRWWSYPAQSGTSPVVPNQRSLASRWLRAAWSPFAGIVGLGNKA